MVWFQVYQGLVDLVWSLGPVPWEEEPVWAAVFSGLASVEQTSDESVRLDSEGDLSNLDRPVPCLVVLPRQAASPPQVLILPAAQLP